MVRWLRLSKLALFLAILMLPGLAAADLLQSSHYRLDPDVADNFGGNTGSNDYALTDSGGEAVVGSGSSQSYQLSAGYQNALPQSISLSVLPTGTVAYYPFDTGSGTQAYDVGANENNGTLTGSPSWISGEIGDALSFNGTSQYVTVPTASSLSQTGSLTIEAWVKLASYTNNNEIVSKTVGNGATNNTYELRTQASTGDLQFLGFDTSLKTITSSSAVPTGGWHQVAVTKNGTTATLFIDGVKVGQGSVGTTTSNTSDMKIGARDDLASGYFMNGDIDDVRLYDTTLSSAQVAGDFAAGTGGLEFAQTMPNVTPGTSTTYSTDCVVRTDASGYQLSIQEPKLLTNSTGGISTIPAIPYSVLSAGPWVEGTTQGFGFTVTAGVDLESSWGTGPYNYAAVPATATVFHTRETTATYPAPDGTPETTTLQFRADTSFGQREGPYSTTVIYSATLIP